MLLTLRSPQGSRLFERQLRTPGVEWPILPLALCLSYKKSRKGGFAHCMVVQPGHQKPTPDTHRLEPFKMDGWPLNSQIKLSCFQIHYFYSSSHTPLIHSRTVATTRQNCSTCSRKLRSFQTSAAPLHSPSSTLAYFFCHQNQTSSWFVLTAMLRLLVQCFDQTLHFRENPRPILNLFYSITRKIWLQNQKQNLRSSIKFPQGYCPSYFVNRRP